MKFFVIVLLLIHIPTVAALQSAALTVGKITVGDWSLKEVSLSLTAIDREQAQWTLKSASLRLPPPFDSVSAFQISCDAFQWRDRFLQCRQGRGRIESKQLHSPTFDFSLQVQDQQGSIRLDNLRLFGGRVSVTVWEQEGNWRVKGRGDAIDLADLHKQIGLDQLQNLVGAANLAFDLRGSKAQLQELFIDALLKRVSLQAGNKLAGEAITLATTLRASRQPKQWHWRSDADFREGGLYVEPVFLEANEGKAISLSGEGVWRPGSDEINLHSAVLRHPSVGELDAVATLGLNSAPLLRQARISARIPDLTTAAPIYLTPFLEAGAFAGLAPAGRLDIGLSMKSDAIEDISLDFSGLGIDDPQRRFQVVDAEGKIDWRPRNAAVSSLGWRQLKLKAIPIEAGRIEFITEGQQFKLQQPADIPLLGGQLNIQRFSYAAENDDTDVHFSGALHNLSLEQLSQALGWTPLSGEISGRIPSVSYRNKKLELNGKLTMQVFDGEVTIKKLASSGMFSDFAQFYADIDVDNLDLNAITRKFQFGSIEGRLSGYAHNLYLENWRPVSFYAWFGTPEDDDSRHRISQKAVENIASIGGGGAADAISRGFMRFFDNFGYDKLGFGCYLNNGVCQMMGVEPAENGYYLVKGGGLPRIDVIGYNPRLDWNVLLQRLRRITATDEAVVE
ncbi:C4-dicarboxylate ABC transporter [Methylomarinum vadi]|uniref:C4-dicarboxylate ABC transporter n=1 Tax=Methylomarinum vadi TaxID=438855 RepID=UPI0012690EE8|nr:C4-dicarboxylate ABC transporter [Methylomarinum vadi]